MRDIDEFALQNVIETGVVKLSARKNKFWVFKEMEGRKDNLIKEAISIPIKNPQKSLFFLPTQ